jgi:hypothetical protein
MSLERRLTGQQGDKFLINDPCGTPKTTLDFSGSVSADSYGHFVGRGFVVDPDGDMSGLDLAVGDSGELLVTDANGRKTGFDTSTTQEIGQIPHSAHFADTLQDDEIGGLATGTNHSVQIFQPAAGAYQVSIIGLKLGLYDLSLRAFSSDGSDQPALSVAGIAGVGSTSSFQIQFSSTPGTVTTVSRIASFQSTLADITNSLQLSLIDNPGIANALSSKIDAASDAAGRADCTSERNILNAFINEVNGLTGKHIIGIGPHVLLGDANSLLSQLP